MLVVPAIIFAVSFFVEDLEEQYHYTQFQQYVKEHCKPLESNRKVFVCENNNYVLDKGE